MRSTALLCALIVLLAGCSGGSSDAPDEEAPPAEPVKTEGGDIVRADLGAIRGRVHDDVNFSLEGARVSLLGTDHFTTSGQGGAFALLNVSVGTHSMQVLKSGFAPYKKDIEVTAGSTTRVEVVMLPEKPRAGGMQPHSHDFWRGRDTYTLMDGSVDLQRGTAVEGIYEALVHPNNNHTRPTSVSGVKSLYEIPIPAGEPTAPGIVLPGTKRIDVTLTWSESTQTLDELGLAYNDVTSSFSNDATFLATKPSGSTWSILVSAEQADNGHQLWTSWNFYLYSGNHVTSGDTPAVMLGEVGVEIVLHAGQVVVDPPHPDHWNGTDHLVVRHSDPKTVNIAIATPSRLDFHLDQGTLVPPGTARMRVHLTWEGPLESVDHTLRWRTGEQNPHTTPQAEYKARDPSESGTGSKTWEFDVEPQEADGYYRHASNWEFTLYRDGESPGDTWNSFGQMEYDLTVEVWR